MLTAIQSPGEKISSNISTNDASPGVRVLRVRGAPRGSTGGGRRVGDPDPRDGARRPSGARGRDGGRQEHLPGAVIA